MKGLKQREHLRDYPTIKIQGGIVPKIDPIVFRVPIEKTTGAGGGATSVAPATTSPPSAPPPASGATRPGTDTGIARSVHQSIEAHPGTDHGPGGGRDNVHRARAARLHPRGPAPTPRPARARTRTTGRGRSSQPPSRSWTFQMVDQVLSQNLRNPLPLLLHPMLRRRGATMPSALIRS